MHIINEIKYICLDAQSAGATAEFAAKELMHYYSMSSGRKLHLDSTSSKECKNTITLKCASSHSEDDSFQIICDSNDATVKITGSNPRSLLFGVYRFLKKTFKISWNSPWPEGEIVPGGQIVELHDYTLNEKANLKYRGFYVDSAQYSVTADNIEQIIDWMAKNSGNFLLVSTMFYEQIKAPLLKALKLRGMILEVGHHGFNFFVDPKKHFAEHPEWFSMLNGKREPGIFFANMIHNSQLCSSNKEVINVYADKFMEFWNANPEIDILGIIPNDGFGWCECEQCAKLQGNASRNPLRHQDLEGNSHTKLGGAQYHHLVNQVAHKVASKRPDRKMAFWAYAGVIQPTDIIRDLPENMILSIALYERWYNYALDDPANLKNPDNVNPHIVDILRQWRDIFPGEINIYEYYAKYCWQSMPKWMPETIRRDIDLFKQLGLQGLLSMAEYDNSVLYEINNLAQFGMSWSASWSSEELLDEYAGGVFAGAEDTVRKQIDQVIELMTPFAKLGPRYPENLTPKAEKGFAQIEINFQELAAEFRKNKKENSTQAAVTLEKWAGNMRMTSEHFALNRLFYRMLAASDIGDYTELEAALKQWRKAKQAFYSSFRSLDKSGACLSDDVWTINRAISLFEYEDDLEKLLNQAQTRNLPKSKGAISKQINKLWHWLC